MKPLTSAAAVLYGDLPAGVPSPLRKTRCTNPVGLGSPRRRSTTSGRTQNGSGREHCPGSFSHILREHNQQVNGRESAAYPGSILSQSFGSPEHSCTAQHRARPAVREYLRRGSKAPQGSRRTLSTGTSGVTNGGARVRDSTAVRRTAANANAGYHRVVTQRDRRGRYQANPLTFQRSRSGRGSPPRSCALKRRLQRWVSRTSPVSLRWVPLVCSRPSVHGGESV
jgi:hypothetical protein